jgi:hypothetical protein
VTKYVLLDASTNFPAGKLRPLNYNRQYSVDDMIGLKHGYFNYEPFTAKRIGEKNHALNFALREIEYNRIYSNVSMVISSIRKVKEMLDKRCCTKCKEIPSNSIMAKDLRGLRIQYSCNHCKSTYSKQFGTLKDLENFNTTSCPSIRLLIKFYISPCYRCEQYGNQWEGNDNGMRITKIAIQNNLVSNDRMILICSSCNQTNKKQNSFFREITPSEQNMACTNPTHLNKNEQFCFDCYNNE